MSIPKVYLARAQSPKARKARNLKIQTEIISVSASSMFLGESRIKVEVPADILQELGIYSKNAVVAFIVHEDADGKQISMSTPFLPEEEREHPDPPTVVEPEGPYPGTRWARKGEPGFMKTKRKVRRIKR